MIFPANLVVHFCISPILEKSNLLPNNDIRTNEEVKSLENKLNSNFLMNFDGLSRNVNQAIDLNIYNKIVRDFFAIITQHPDIKKKLDNLISKKTEISQTLFFPLFKEFLYDLDLGKLQETKCLAVTTFLNSLAEKSYNLLLRLSSIKNLNIYKNNRGNIKYQILNSVDLEFDENCESKITQLFDNQEYNRFIITFSEINDEEHVRNKRNVPIYITTRKPILLDDVKKVYLAGDNRVMCINGICTPLLSIS
ncbi:uncharacterized protein VNE69_09108 [Vairimorpha necatrix]|uniref:Uncharacterized protein n=1 Tax=Vairimorpha necatrix TaxID=6039 RepID=A0AAX4JFC8_9MICR